MLPERVVKMKSNEATTIDKRRRGLFYLYHLQIHTRQSTPNDHLEIVL